jgi:hypothetical protein
MEQKLDMDCKRCIQVTTSRDEVLWSMKKLMRRDKIQKSGLLKVKTVHTNKVHGSKDPMVCMYMY